MVGNLKAVEPVSPGRQQKRRSASVKLSANHKLTLSMFIAVVTRMDETIR